MSKHLSEEEYEEIISKLIEQEIINSRIGFRAANFVPVRYYLGNSIYFLYCYHYFANKNKVVIYLKANNPSCGPSISSERNVSLEEIMENVEEEMKKKILFNLDIFNSFLQD